MNNIKERLISIFERHPVFFFSLVSYEYPLTIEQIRKYKDVLKWEHNGYRGGTGISENINLDWNTEFVEEYKEKFDWYELSMKIIGRKWWFDGLIDKYSDKINWMGLSMNRDINWSKELFEKYEDCIDWGYLSYNPCIEWTAELIEKYESKIDFLGISTNSSLPWALRWEYMQVESKEYSIEETLNYIDRFNYKLLWTELHFNWNKGMTRFYSDEIIDEVFNRLNQKKRPIFKINIRSEMF